MQQHIVFIQDFYSVFILFKINLYSFFMFHFFIASFWTCDYSPVIITITNLQSSGCWTWTLYESSTIMLLLDLEVHSFPSSYVRQPLTALYTTRNILPCEVLTLGLKLQALMTQNSAEAITAGQHRNFTNESFISSSAGVTCKVYLVVPVVSTMGQVFAGKQWFRFGIIGSNMIQCLVFNSVAPALRRQALVLGRKPDCRRSKIHHTEF